MVGVDHNPQILKIAYARCQAAGQDNVVLAAADLNSNCIADLVGGGVFDAIVGRFVLMYLPHPAQTLRSLLTALRAGGIIACHEFNLTAAR